VWNRWKLHFYVFKIRTVQLLDWVWLHICAARKSTSWNVNSTWSVHCHHDCLPCEETCSCHSQISLTLKLP
jgi:hypothetical protein